MPILKITEICKQSHVLMRRSKKYWETIIYFDEVGQNAYKYYTKVIFKQDKKPTDEQLETRAQEELIKKQNKIDTEVNEPKPELASKAEIIYIALSSGDKLSKETKDLLKLLRDNVKSIAKAETEDVSVYATKLAEELVTDLFELGQTELAEQIQSAIPSIQSEWEGV